MKIDVVYTWVDGSDPNWVQKKTDKAKLIGDILPDSNSESRFMDNQELKYSLRSIYKFAPWINNIFIVTDNQTPDWLNLSHPKINIVNHTDIFNDSSILPTFNSRGIESQIHHIKELSEHFMYLNDDMFLGNYCSPINFYTKNGLPRIFVSEIIPIPKKKSFDISKRDREKINDHQHAIVNSRKLIKTKFKKSVHYNIRHGAIPLLKSIMYKLEDTFKPHFENTSRKCFRTEEEILVFYLFEYYALIKNIGKATYLKTVSSKKRLTDIFSSLNNTYTYGYLNLHDDNIDRDLMNIKERKPFINCLNQTTLTSLENLEKVKKFFSDFLPEKSPFEKIT